MLFRIGFFGIHRIGEAALGALLDAGLDVVWVITKADEPEYVQPVAALARSRGLPLLQPDSVKSEEFLHWLSAFGHDLQVVAGFHKILPERVLAFPPHGTINLHDSLLPRYRGPNAWKWVIINGEQETGVTVHRMSARPDQGDILGQRRLTIGPDETGGSLFERLSVTGAELLVETIRQLAAGTVRAVAQNESEATYFPAPTHEQCGIDWARDAAAIRNLLRGLAPRPGAWTRTPCGDELRIFRAQLLDDVSGVPGTIVARRDEGYVVAAGRGGLLIETATVLNVGERLGS